MQDKKVANDATASLAGSIFQFCVALDQCFRLGKSESLWIERFGDVTTSEVQIETKQYADNLTDNHPNFWKTLKNWCDGSFDHAPYSKLVLLTTQTIGPQCKLQKWNDASATDRVGILETIWKEAGKKYEAAKEKEPQAKPSGVLKIQRKLMKNDNRQKLLEVAGKVLISSESEGMHELWDKMKYLWGKGVLDAKRGAFLEGALGYIINPDVIEGGWEVIFDGFDAKVAELRKTYGRDTLVFPKRYQVPLVKIGQNEVDLYQEKNFVKKIVEIGYQGKILSIAISNYLYANDTVLKDFKEYEISPESCQGYIDGLVRIHETRHRSAKRNMGSDQMAASQTFYDAITGADAQPFPGFDVTPIDFRNGVYHMLADEKDEVVWRLW
ncbi:hypothetical protein [Dyella acidisoli]|uniref:Uncharacterized protein n=1 Tax=Dyella acidisoli TaxID=1867834 RepID=A0ABQ5XQM1_9GAMM|nr:hypothetical protein [Dyella acidisoli]GLQ92803.1 hypothetical protein GCM10007901_17540 [Dyella acidisoli]